MSSTDSPARSDTAPSPGRSSAKLKKPLASGGNSFVVVALVMAFVVIPIVLTVVIGAVIWFMVPQAEPPGKSGPPKLEVSRDPSRKNTYTTIHAALRNAEIGSVIELWDETYEENVSIDQAAAAYREQHAAHH